MAHSHHGHTHVDPEAGDGRILWALGVNLLLTLAQVVGGLLAGSLALIADALHNFSDAISLGLAFLARKIARRPASARLTFGYARAETVAALVNYVSLIIIGLYLAYEAVVRFFDPQQVDGWLVIVIAGAALAVDLITAALTFAMSKSSMNIRAAFLHNVADALGSVGVIVGGVLILLYDWRLADPLITLMIAGYILWQAFSEIGGVIRLLMLGTPPGMNPREVVVALTDIEGVAGLHHVHLWMLDENTHSFEAHVAVDEGEWPRAEEIKSAAKALLRDRFSVSHCTLEMEVADAACGDEGLFSHGRHGARL